MTKKYMPRGIPLVSQEVKDQILKRIREDGMPVAQVAEEHGLRPRIIYQWISKGVNAPPSILEIARLKRENQALKEVIGELTAVEQQGRPNILHSDQGSEYKSKLYTGFAKDLGIQISMSHKGCPWENGYQESFYSQFKVDLGDPNRFRTVGELSAVIYQQIYYYNNERIHLKLKMSPNQYDRMRQLLTTNSLSARL